MKVCKLIALIILPHFVLSCSGYRIKQMENPFLLDGVLTISIPMFINRSNIPRASQDFTREIKRILVNYSGLKFTTGKDLSADAILIGLITGPRRRADTFATTSRELTTGVVKKSTGQRNEFFVPRTTSYNLNLRLILIKNPRKVDLHLAKGELAPMLKGPKVIFNHNLDLVGKFSRETRDTLSPDSGGIVNFTKSKASFERSLEDLAKSAALQFENEVINVF